MNGVEERRGLVDRRWTSEGGRVAVHRMRLVFGRAANIWFRMVRVSSAKSGPDQLALAPLSAVNTSI